MQKKNVLMGTLMAILFGLIGCVVWGVLYYFEIIAGLASFLIVFLAGVGYKKFGKVKYFTKKDYLILIVISLVELILTFLICYGILIKGIYAEAGITITLFEGVTELFSMANEYAEIKAAIATDIIVSVLFLVVGIVYYIRHEKRKKLKDEAAELNNPANNQNVTIVPYTEEYQQTQSNPEQQPTVQPYTEQFGNVQQNSTEQPQQNNTNVDDNPNGQF